MRIMRADVEKYSNNSPKHTLQKLCKQGKLLGSFSVCEHIEHVSRSFISSTGTMSEALVILIEAFRFPNI